MSFEPQFLDELRARLSLAAVVGRHVRLIRRGHEFVGLCPFHKEKSPSFNVVEDKGFYHCFGCGAHGDVIGFVMQTRNLGFPETVELLAGEAGLELPEKAQPDHGRNRDQPSLRQAMEAATAFFAAQLAGAEGSAARAYLNRRGLDEAAALEFRIGFAPAGRDGLKAALGRNFPEALLLEAGLLRRPEGGGAAYDYFRNRIIFPIGDRSGKVIAFGGRVLGDGQPKYLNSPESPIFQKGRVLYGWATARAACAKDATAIVTEGYMDVIALHRAGFKGAVAPLGTALTEAQLEELWKLSPEPILCFDGDAAGLRAAMRAADRALPLLKPGMSLRFSTMPEGEDPDTLVAKFGARAMQEVLGSARPLMEILWEAEMSVHPLDTPERRAHLEQRLETRTKLIADRMVSENYRRFFRNRLFESYAPRRNGRPFQQQGQGRAGAKPQANPEPPRRSDPGPLHSRRQQEVLLSALINHPWLLQEVEEEFVAIDFTASDLDKIRREIINVLTLRPDLDAEAFKLHLSQAGLTETLDSLMSLQVSGHASFSVAGSDPMMVREGWRSTMAFIRRRGEQVDRDQLERNFAIDPTPENWSRLQAFLSGTTTEHHALDDEAGAP